MVTGPNTYPSVSMVTGPNTYPSPFTDGCHQFMREKDVKFHEGMGVVCYHSTHTYRSSHFAFPHCMSAMYLLRCTCPHAPPPHVPMHHPHMSTRTTPTCPLAHTHFSGRSSDSSPLCASPLCSAGWIQFWLLSSVPPDHSDIVFQLPLPDNVSGCLPSTSHTLRIPGGPMQLLVGLCAFWWAYAAFGGAMRLLVSLWSFW